MPLLSSPSVFHNHLTPVITHHLYTSLSLIFSQFIYGLALQVSELRKQWVRFGGAKGETASDSVTMQGMEEIPFERVRQLKATQSEKKEAQNVASALASADKMQISGR